MKKNETRSLSRMHTESGASVRGPDEAVEVSAVEGRMEAIARRVDGRLREFGVQIQEFQVKHADVEERVKAMDKIVNGLVGRNNTMEEQLRVIARRLEESDRPANAGTCSGSFGSSATLVMAIAGCCRRKR